MSKPKIRKNFRIEILKYAQKHREFTIYNLFQDKEFNQSEKDFFDRNLSHSIIY